MSETSPEIGAIVHARIMAKTGEERLLRGVHMHEATRRMVMASFPPGISDDEHRQLLSERFYGGERPSASRNLASRNGKGDYVKNREALFGNDTVDSLFEQALALQPK